jgi:hypothetical protein
MIKLGKVVKSDSHCDYIVQVDDGMEVRTAPQPEDYGFGSFVKLETPDRHWAVGLVYNSQLFNPMYLNTGPRLSSEVDLMFTPDLIRETRTLLWTVLIGILDKQGQSWYGKQGIPRIVVPINTPVWTMTPQEVHGFHLDVQQQPQFCYYSHVLGAGGAFAVQLLAQVLEEITPLFEARERRALAVLSKELAWKHTLGIMR